MMPGKAPMQGRNVRAKMMCLPDAQWAQAGIPVMPPNAFPMGQMGVVHPMNRLNPEFSMAKRRSMAENLAQIQAPGQPNTEQQDPNPKQDETASQSSRITDVTEQEDLTESSQKVWMQTMGNMN